MSQAFIDAVQRTADVTVLTYMSQIVFDPDYTYELFVLADPHETTPNPGNARRPSGPSSRARASPRTPARPRGSPRSGSSDSRSSTSSRSRSSGTCPGTAQRADDRLVAGERQRRVGGDLRRRARSVCSSSSAALDHVVHEAHRERPVGVDVAADEEQLVRVRDSADVDELRQPGVRVDQAELGRRHADLDAARGDPDVARERELEPAADRVAVERGDHGVGVALERLDRVVNGWATSFSALSSNACSSRLPMS